MDITEMQYTFNGHILGFGAAGRARRRARLTALMERESLDCILALGRGVDGLCQWITAYPGPDIPGHKDGAYLLHKDGPLIDIGSDAVLDEAFRRSHRELDEMPGPFFSVENTEYRPGLDRADLRLSGDGRIGLVHPDLLKKAQRDYLQQTAPGAQLIDVTLPVLEMISVKDAEEIDAMRTAANSHDRLFSMMQFVIRPERLEKEIVTELRYLSYSMGGAGQDNTRMTLINLTSAPDGGPRREEPLLYPGRRLQTGDRVNITVRAESYNDYYAGLGRCFVLSDPCEETERCWRTAVEAQHRAAARMKPGALLSEAAQEVNQYLRGCGVPEDPTAFLYGIGYTVGEVPVLYGAGADVSMREGMTIVAAPSVRLAGKDPFCCMDTYLITADGCERLTQSPQELIILKQD